MNPPLSRSKILLVGDYPPPPGGIATHVAQLQRFLRSQGVDTQVLDIGKGGRLAPDVTHVSSVRGYFFRLAKFFSERWPLHLHISGNNWKAWAVAASCAPSPRGAVLTVHSGLFPAFIRGATGLRPWVGSVLRQYRCIVAVSEAVEEALLELGLDPGRVRRIPAFLPSQLRPSAPTAAFSEARARFCPLFAMAHHPGHVYGRDVMFQALQHVAARFPNAGLCLFGPGTATVEFARAVALAGVVERIEPLGEIDHPAALGVIAKSDVFVRPTLADGDSISVREALALKTPCVASNVVPRPEGTRVFQTGNARALAAALVDALEEDRVPRPLRAVEPLHPFEEQLLDVYERAWGKQREERNGERAAAARLGGVFQ